MTKSLNVRLSEETYKALADIANEQEVNLADVVRAAIREKLSNPVR